MTQKKQEQLNVPVKRQIRKRKSSIGENRVELVKLLIGALVTLADCEQQLRTSLETGTLSSLDTLGSRVRTQSELLALKELTRTIFDQLKTLTFISKDWRLILNEEERFALVVKAAEELEKRVGDNPHF